MRLVREKLIQNEMKEQQADPVNIKNSWSIMPLTLFEIACKPKWCWAALRSQMLASGITRFDNMISDTERMSDRRIHVDL